MATAEPAWAAEAVAAGSALQRRIDAAGITYAGKVEAWLREGQPGSAPDPEIVDVPAGVYQGPLSLAGGVTLRGVSRLPPSPLFAGYG